MLPKEEEVKKEEKPAKAPSKHKGSSYSEASSGEEEVQSNEISSLEEDKNQVIDIAELQRLQKNSSKLD